MDAFLKFDDYTIFLLSMGVIALLAASVPHIVKKSHISPPIVYAGIGVVLFFTGSHLELIDYLADRDVVHRLSEFVVIVALTGAGLKIKNPFSLKTWKLILPVRANSRKSVAEYSRFR